jgi:hypothetical protein
MCGSTKEWTRKMIYGVDRQRSGSTKEWTRIWMEQGKDTDEDRRMRMYVDKESRRHQLWGSEEKE